MQQQDTVVPSGCPHTYAAASACVQHGTERLREWMASRLLKPLVRALDGAHTHVTDTAARIGWQGVQLQPLEGQTGAWGVLSGKPAGAQAGWAASPPGRCMVIAGWTVTKQEPLVSGRAVCCVGRLRRCHRSAVLWPAGFCAPTALSCLEQLVAAPALRAAWPCWQPDNAGPGSGRCPRAVAATAV